MMVAMVIVWGSVLVKLRRFGAVMAAMKVMAERRMVVKGLTRMHQLVYTGKWFQNKIITQIMINRQLTNVKPLTAVPTKSGPEKPRFLQGL